MTMKKILAMLLAICMLFAFVACGGEDKDDEDTDDKKGTITSNADDEDEDKEDKEDEDTEDKEDEDKNEDFGIGTTSSSTYKNKFIGLGFKIPDGWESYDEEEIAAISQISSNASGKDLEEAFENASMFYDLFTHSEDEISSVNIIFEKSTKSQIAKLDFEELAETTIDQVTDAYENMGFEVIDSDVTKIKLAGKKLNGYTLVSELGDITLYQAGVIITKGNYLVSISIGAKSESELEELIDAFYTL